MMTSLRGHPLILRALGSVKRDDEGDSIARAEEDDMIRRSRGLVSLGVALLLIAAPALGQQPQKRALTLEDYYRIESVSAPAISPDGSRVAFVRTVILEDENRRHSEIWLTPSDGSSPPRRL